VSCRTFASDAGIADTGDNVPDIKAVEPPLYREAMSRFAGAVHVVTTDGPHGKRGMTIIAACSVSDSPPTILVCLNRTKPENDCFAQNGVFALNTLAPEHQALADAFSGLTGLSQDERFALGRWETVSSGAPVLRGALATFDCHLEEAKEVATHRILIGRVTGIRIGDFAEPLVYYRRAYRVLGEG
jgi:cob(II)yrinic acid a,c-diamide reductase